MHSVDLVIPSESDMIKLLLLLVVRLKTVDGDKNSGVAILEFMNNKELSKIENPTAD